MNIVKCRLKKIKFIHYYLLFYFVINLLFLTDFPFIHSDESWLSGLSRAMFLENDLSVTEPFFDTYQRYPHAIKILFHLLQIVFINLFGYNIFSFRLLSLIFSIGSLYFFNNLCRLLFQSNRVAILTTILLSLDIQFIYASHFSRQEIIILFVMILSVYILLNNLQNHNCFKDLFLGILIGLSIGIHPNSFIVGLSIGAIYLFFIIYKKLKIKNLIIYISVVVLFAILFISISFVMDANFIEHYFETGVKFNVHKSFWDKLLKIKTFYSVLFLKRSSTYYLPNIKFQLLTFGVTYIMMLIMLIKDKSHNYLKRNSLFVYITFINLGIIIIGRYNVTSVLFIFPFMYILTVTAFLKIVSNKKYIMSIFLIITFVNALINILPFYKNSYDDYIKEISSYVNSNNVVLSNLNTEYYFDKGKIFDYRNLSFIKEKGISFSQYIDSRNIQYIIYYDEIDYIYEQNPRYNGIYGDVSSYFMEMQFFLQNECNRIYSFSNSTYGTNIFHLIDKKQWQVHIYKVRVTE